MNILEVRNLNKTYKDFQLKDVNLTIPKGYIMGFVGQNGAGKTSTINLINHICKCDSGSIKIDGISYADDPVRYKESIAYVGDESNNAQNFDGQFVFEKPNVSQIMLHTIKEGRM